MPIQEDLIPHTSLLVLFTTSAQTHIFPELRIDAIRFLDLFLESIPHSIVGGWSEPNAGHGSRVLEGYLGVLNAGTKFGEADGKHF
jgi:pre-rRNA-processing protein IPI1